MALFKNKNKKLTKKEEKALAETPAQALAETPEETQAETKEDTVTTKEIAKDVFLMLPTKQARSEFESWYNEFKRLNDLAEDLEKIKELQE